MGDLIIPGKKQPKQIKTTIMIPFVFSEADSMDTILTKLDSLINEKRDKTIEAIAKIKNIKLKWN